MAESHTNTHNGKPHGARLLPVEEGTRSEVSIDSFHAFRSRGHLQTQ